MNVVTPPIPDRQDIEVLSERFWDAYKTFRQEWLKTGGGMEMELKVRDRGAEEEFQRRSAAAKKGAMKRALERRPLADSPPTPWPGSNPNKGNPPDSRGRQ